MELVTRDLPSGGRSRLRLSMHLGALVLGETDVGAVADQVYGGGVEHLIGVSGPGRERVLDLLLGYRGDADAVDLAQLGATLLVRFGEDLHMTRRYRDWLSENGIAFSTYVDS